jgi:hypothetical protein
MNPLLVLFFISIFIDDYFFKNGALSKYYLYSIITYSIFTMFTSSTLDTTNRRFLMAAFSQSVDSTCYGSSNFKVKKAKELLQKVSEKIGKKLSLTLCFAKIVGEVFNKFPDCDNTIKFGNHARRKTTDVCVLINVQDGGNLACVTLKDVNNKTFEQLYDELYPNIDNIRTGKDKEFKENNDIGRILPSR